MNLTADNAVARVLHAAIKRGDVASLARELHDRPELATARVIDERGVSRTLLHLVADWPGKIPNGPEMVALLVAAGAEVNAAVSHTARAGAPETPLHWAASNDDVALINALLDHGADIEAAGAAFTNGSPMSDAVVFAQWHAARALLARGATTTLWQAAALGALDRVRTMCALTPSVEQLTNALWHACRAGQLAVATYLVERGADVHWVGHDGKSVSAVARASDNASLVEYLRTQGATS